MTAVAALTDLTLRWSEHGEQPPELLAQRRAIYGGELGWVDPAAGATWDRYDKYSPTLLVYAAGELIASGRLTVESDGPSELSDLVDWRSALPSALAEGVGAEWSRVMIAPAHRRRGLFARMYELVRVKAAARGAVLLGGASVLELRPRYERLGFQYLELPFRCDAFAASPVYYPAYQRLR